MRLTSWACIIKHFKAVINSVVQKTSTFAIVNHFLLALTNTLAFYITELITAVMSFMIKAPGPKQYVQYVPALSAHIRLSCKTYLTNVLAQFVPHFTAVTLGWLWPVTVNWRHYTQHDGTQYNDNQHNCKNVQLFVIIYPFMLRIVKLIVIRIAVHILSTSMIKIILLSAVVQNVMMLSVIRVSIVIVSDVIIRVLC